jgi:hypothetical protein
MRVKSEFEAASGRATDRQRDSPSRAAVEPRLLYQLGECYESLTVLPIELPIPSDLLLAQPPPQFRPVVA